ncbi:hypothetical protein TRVA0_010S02256 [Trichomonascus vanleenenianus]|uniref:Zn(II)2Cys6 transcription factor domain-containing protein n=1 Tax=Trichomonascus vanleenenianus TaxID=2268995 RepID=UPI003ECAD6C5
MSNPYYRYYAPYYQYPSSPRHSISTDHYATPREYPSTPVTSPKKLPSIKDWGDRLQLAPISPSSSISSTASNFSPTNGASNTSPHHRPSGHSRSISMDNYYYSSPRTRVGLGIYSDRVSTAQVSVPPQPVLQAGKDIKRRTKTGCLTCRKRRIKCDEQHPTCVNCDKSKRVCLGYDPIFRMQVDRRRNRRSISKKPFTPLLTTRPLSPGKEEDTTTKLESTKSLVEGIDNAAQESDRMRINSLLDAAAVIESKPKWTTWGQVCQYYTEHIAPSLDAVFATTRFGDICSTPHHFALGASTDESTSAQDLAVIEALRQLLGHLCPMFNLSGLTIDESKITKLEELRITNDYKLMRLIVQLVSSQMRPFEYLGVAEGDSEIYTKVMALERFVTRIGNSNSESACSSTGDPDDSSDVPVDQIIDELSIAEASSSDRIWQVAIHISRDGTLTADQLSKFASIPVESRAMDLVRLLALLYYATIHQNMPDAAVYRGRVDELTSFGDLVIQRIVVMINRY